MNAVSQGHGGGVARSALGYTFCWPPCLFLGPMGPPKVFPQSISQKYWFIAGGGVGGGGGGGKFVFCQGPQSVQSENGGPVVQSDAGLGIGIGMGWGGGTT